MLSKRLRNYQYPRNTNTDLPSQIAKTDAKGFKIFADTLEVDDDDESKAGTAESLCTRFPRFKGEEPIKLATKTAQERQEVVRLTGILTNPRRMPRASKSLPTPWRSSRSSRSLHCPS